MSDSCFDVAFISLMHVSHVDVPLVRMGLRCFTVVSFCKVTACKLVSDVSSKGCAAAEWYLLVCADLAEFCKRSAWYSFGLTLPFTALGIVEPLLLWWCFVSKLCL